MEFIRTAEALDLMEKPVNGEKVPFNITFVAYDKARKTGGQVRELRNVIRCGLSHDMNSNFTIGVRSADGKGHVVAIHTWLILQFNDRKVLP